MPAMPRPFPPECRARYVLVTALFSVLLAAAPPLATAGADLPRPAPVHGEVSEGTGVDRFGEPDDLGAGAAEEYRRQLYRIPSPDDRGYDVLHYDLDLAIDPGTRGLAGTVTITLRALRELDLVRLDLVDEFDVAGLEWNGAAAFHLHEQDSLAVTLPAPLYREHNDSPGDPGPPVPVVASISEPYSPHSWWPCKDHPGDKATAVIAVTAPDSLRVVANGVLESREAAGAGLARTVWREDSPIATYLVAIAVSDYREWSEDCLVPQGSVRLDYHVYPEDLAAARIDFAPTCAMMEFIVGLCGPYPFADEKYAQVEVEWGGGMENQTATAVGAFALTGEGQWESLVVHEIAHSWFGNSLTPALWRDIWLNEGFARYCEALWVEHTRGDEDYLAFMQSIGVERWPDLFVGEELLGDPAPPVLAANKRLVYDKGAWVVHMLRGYLGDATFFAFLRAYADHPDLRYGNTTTADLIAIASEVAGEDLEPFFAPWLETDAVPVLAINTLVATRGDRSRVRIVVNQIQDPTFVLRLPIRIRTSREVLDDELEISGPAAHGVWTVAGRHPEIEIDPDGWVLHRLAAVPPPLLTLLPTMPNPVPPEAEPMLRWYLREDAAMEVSLFDVRGRRLRRWDLGIQGATGGAEEGGDPAVWTMPLRTTAPPLAAAVYWVEVRAGSGRAVRRLTFLR